jgi:hypothetical protein
MHRSIMTIAATVILLSGGIWPATSTAQIAQAPAPSSLTSPFNLAYLAYQGYLEDQGIPSNGALINAIASGTITARDLIQAAIKTNRLPEAITPDQSYRTNLDSFLQGLGQN